MGKEIVRAAIKVNDRLYIGFDHGECFKQIDEHTVNTGTLVEGFIDSDYNFVDRKQAMVTAKEAGQLRYETNKETLISEDLHLDWLNKQAKQIAELNDDYEDLLSAKGTEHELMQVMNDVEMLDKRRLCLFSMLYEVLEKQGYENVTSVIEQMTDMHLNRCNHWYKNNRSCDELEKRLVELESKIRKQICDEIREKSWYSILTPDNIDNPFEYEHHIHSKLLDEIERGENGKN